MFRILRPVLLLLPLIGCERANHSDPSVNLQGVPTMQVSSSAFKDGDSIPPEFTADDVDVSPPLQWQGAPGDTKSYVLICDDPDAPRGTWTHWVIFNIPADRHELPKAVPTEREVLDGARQGINSFKKIGYGGPNPPAGKPHHYIFTVYALDTLLDLPAGSSKQDVEKAMKGHIRASGKVTGLFKH